MAPPQAHVVLQRMAADIDAQHFFLESQFQLLRILPDVGHLDDIVLFVLLVREVEQGHLPCHIVLLGTGKVVHHPHVDAHQLLARGSQAVQRARFYEILDDPLVDLAVFKDHAGQKIVQVAERPSLLSLRDHGVDHRSPDPFDRCQSVADRAAGYGKSGLSLIDVGRQEFYSHTPAGQNIARHLVGKIDDRCHQSCHELRRIIVFEPRGLVSDHCIAGRMGLVESVLGKVHHRVVDVGRHLGADPLCGASRNAFLGIAVDEIAPLLFHDLLLLLGHGAPHKVASAQCIAAQIPDDLHYLLLIHDTSVCGLQDRLKFLRVVGDPVGILLAEYIFWYEIHRTRPVERDPCNDVLEILWAELLHESLHSAGFKLEDAVRFSG